VIVKTDFNYGGLPEKRLSSNLYFVRAVSAKLTMPFRANRAGQTAWSDVRTLDSSHYPVFPSLREVPKEIFDNKNLVTEKFIPEIEDGRYCVRYYHFLGDREVCEIFRSHNEIVKGSDEGEFETSPLPSELYEIRQQLGIDYGKIDFVLNEGKVVLLDVNPTPGLPSYGKGELARGVAHQLADGILSKLD